MTFLDRASQAIRNSGGRMTDQRRRIIEVLADTEVQIDAEGIYQQLIAENISLATIYRTLNVLEDADLIHARYTSQDHDRKYYEPVSAGEKRYNFRCRSCGTVITFETPLVDALREQLSAQGLEVLHGCICLDGLCAACQQSTVPAEAAFSSPSESGEEAPDSAVTNAS